MPDACTDLLSLASVIGRTFDLKVLARIADSRPEDEVLANLERAMAAGIIDEVEDAAELYRFSHVLIQEALLDELTAARKMRRHVRIAEAMEALHGPNPGFRAGELVRHLAQAIEQLGTAKLVRYALLAAEHALASYAPHEALALLDRALSAKEKHAG